MNKQHGLEMFAAKFNKTPQGLGSVRAELSRLLRSMDMVGWNTHEESGRIDRKAFTRFATGSANIFSRRTLEESETSAVSVLVDCSGSMHNEMPVAQAVTIQLCKLLDNAKASYCVTGFKNGGGEYFSKQESGSAKIKELIVETAKFIPFKQWNEPLLKAAPKLGYMSMMVTGGTPDYAALFCTVDELRMRPETRKVLFLITDASGYNPDNMRHIQLMADKHKIKLVAIGIGRTDVEQCFDNAQNVYSVDDLGSVAFSKLLKGLK